jgi:hypothetical protein
MTETVLWGWEQHNDNTCHGTFESREEAIEDALEHLHPREKRTITIGHIQELEAADYIGVDSGVMLDQAAQECWDEFNYEGDRPFDFVSAEIIPEAVQELHKFIREWAGKYLYNVDGFYILEDTETVELVAKERFGNEDEDCGGGGVQDRDDDYYDDSEDDEDSEEEDERDEEEKTDEGEEEGVVN